MENGHICRDQPNISGEYCAIIPEWIINEMGWYEDTKLSWKIDDDNVIITEEDE